jgi:hypothetical protein
LDTNKYLKRLLKDLYFKCNYSQNKIAEVLGKEQSFIWKLFVRYNIKVKPIGQHAITHGKSQKSKKYYCKECGVQVSDYRKNYCTKCFQLGSRNPQYKGGTTKYFCKYCNAEISYVSAKYKNGLCLICGNKERKKRYKKEKHPCWRGGVSRMPYPYKFNKDLKNKIRSRDNYKCQKCGISHSKSKKLYNYTLPVHHIDYDKQNCKEENLITLCVSCHCKTIFNVDYWYAYFRYIMENFK